MTKTADLQSIIVLGIDGHLRSNQVGRKIDHGAISPAQSMSFEVACFCAKAIRAGRKGLCGLPKPGRWATCTSRLCPAGRVIPGRKPHVEPHQFIS
jgi:hypothetical protein